MAVVCSDLVRLLQLTCVQSSVHANVRFAGQQRLATQMQRALEASFASRDCHGVPLTQSISKSQMQVEGLYLFARVDNAYCKSGGTPQLIWSRPRLATLCTLQHRSLI